MSTQTAKFEEQVLKGLRERLGIAVQLEGRDVLVGAGSRVGLLISLRTPVADLPFAVMEFDRSMVAVSARFREHYGPAAQTVRVLVAGEQLPVWARREFRQMGVAYLDFKGPFFVPLSNDLGEAPLVRPVEAVKGDGVHVPGMLNRSRGAQEHLLFAITSSPGLRGLAQRGVAEAIGMSLSTVNYSLLQLAEKKIVERKKGVWTVQDKNQVAARWLAFVEKHGADLTAPQRFRLAQPAQVDLQATLQDLDFWWGGDRGADLLTHDLKSQLQMIYCSKPQRGTLIQRLRLVPDKDGEIELRRRFWRFDWPEMERKIVPPLLIYADLMLSGDSRAAKTAARILADHVHAG